MYRHILFLFVLLFGLPLMAQITVTGNVTDEQGVPLPGASVLIKGTTRGTATDFDGNYTIEAMVNDVLEISSLGFTTREIKVTNPRGGGNRLTINVLLSEDAQVLDDVVVTAFTTQKKASVVGAVQTVRPTELKVPSSNLSTSFAGRIAGVIAFQRSGQPGADGANFYIRGVATMNGVTNPLIILDGVQVSQGDLNALDPEVIDSFSVLKDATATALYGSRGANGVLIINTKSGENIDKPKMSLRVETNVSQPGRKLPQFVSGPEYMRLYNEAADNLSSGVVRFSQQQIDGTAQRLNPYVFPDVDWYNELLTNTAYAQRVNFNVRGGGQRVTYFMNLNFNNEDGMIRDRSSEFFSFSNNLNVKRYTFQNNVSAKLTETTKLGLRLNVQMNQTKGPNMDNVGSIFSYAMNNNRVDFPVSYPASPDDTHIKWGAYTGGNQARFNPLAALVSGYKENFNSTVVANLEFEQKFDFWIEGLKFNALGSFKNFSNTTATRSAPYNTYALTSWSRTPSGAYDLVTNLNDTEVNVILTSGQGSSGDRKIFLQGILGYNHTFDRVHSVEAQAIYNQESTNLNNIWAENSYGMLINSLPRRSQSLAGRLSYAFDSRYMIEFNVGYNGSENFAKNKRWGVFPAVGAGWNVSSEKFFEPLKDMVQNLKLRGSWGLVGNDRIGSERYVYLANVNLNGASYTTGFDQNYTLSGPTYNRYANYDLTWEIAEKLNLGIDLSVLNGLSMTFDVFQEIRKNIFQQRGTVPTYLGTGNTTIYGNTGKVENKGFDFSLNYDKQVNDDLQIAMKGTFTFARNKILKFDEPLVQQYPNLMNVGRSLHMNMGYIAEGLFIDNAEVANWADQRISSNVAAGDIKYRDIADRNGVVDGIIDGNDRVAMGYPVVPEITYGFGPNIKYKNFDMGVFFQGVANTSLMMSGFHPFGTNGRRSVVDYVAADYWSPTNQNIYAAYPRLTKDDHANNTVASSFWLRDGSFLKLKSAEVGFTYDTLRIYVSGTNLYTFSKFKHWDPEQGSGGGFSYPLQRTITLGVQWKIN